MRLKRSAGVDAWVRVAVAGIEVVTVEARVDLGYAETLADVRRAATPTAEPRVPEQLPRVISPPNGRLEL